MLSVTLTFLGMDPSSYFISISLLHIKYIGKKKIIIKSFMAQKKAGFMATGSD